MLKSIEGKEVFFFLSFSFGNTSVHHHTNSVVTYYSPPSYTLDLTKSQVNKPDNLFLNLLFP